MKTLVSFVMLSSYLALSPAQAQQSDPATASDVKPTQESLHQLLEITGAKASTEAISQQVDAYYTSFVSKLLEGKSVSAEQQQTIDKMRQKISDMMKETFTWESMEPAYLEIYGKSFSQAEIDSMISFYGSPAGHAVVVKLPLVMQNTMGVMQQRMQALMPKIQQMAKDAAAEIKASQDGSAKPKTG